MNKININPNTLETLESKLKPEQIKPEVYSKYEGLSQILNKEDFYHNCMYCGRIYSGNYERVIYQNGIGPLGREFNEYNISTGVGPCCIDTYKKQLDKLKRG